MPKNMLMIHGKYDKFPQMLTNGIVWWFLWINIIGFLIFQRWFYQLTGKIYLGAVLNAALVAWMFVSSQVIAPIPV